MILYCAFLCFQVVMAIGTNLAKYLHYDQNLPLTKTQRSSITMKWFCWKLQKKDVFRLLFFSLPVMSDSLWPHRLQHARPPCPSPSPRVCPSSCSLHQWCRPAISSSDALFSFCPQSFPASGTFPISRLLTSGDQNTGASSSAPILPMSMGIQVWFRVDFL